MSILKRWVVPGVVAVCAVTAITLFSETDKIEADLTKRAQAVLQDKGMDWANISFSGRDGTLTGIEPEKNEASWAIELLDAEWGVRTVSNETEELKTQSPYSWGLVRDDDQVSIIGYLPYRLTRTLPSEMEEKMPGVLVQTQVEAARGAPANIENVVQFTTDLLSSLDNAKAFLLDNTLTITGQLEDGNPADIAKFKAAQEKIAAADLEGISFDFQIPEPKAPEDMVKPVATTVNGLEITRSADGVRIMGLMPSQEIKDTVIDLANRKFGTSVVTEGLDVREGEKIANLGYDDYRRSSVAILQAVSRLEEGSASLTENGLDLTGGAFYGGALEDVMRGLQDALPASVALNTDLRVAAPGETVDAEQCQRLLRSSLETNTILFESGMAAISPDSFGLLDTLIYTARRCTDNRIQIEGHTDSDGDDAANQALSERRAGAVADYLVSAGITADRLEAKGFGEDQPVASNDTPEGKAKNRRIEFVILTQ
ncbi:OmpA-OmpF porin, OOP family [Cohaesibacter sp. ES.047]|uniref:OmpA family protein n=1 Tax=Cohaesibacter sp. ES.047 TaxID=1798205 RepID=UPI000BB7B452|nr:OmpA family protein [Cohaesibacter sp. ES.047]SNY92532.1 OmpA-OmpF porin, OOP family [Cohaesibacter sp. ES.047]